MANAVLTGKVRVKVPATIRVDLNGKLPDGVMAKDVFLHLLSLRWCRRDKPSAASWSSAGLVYGTGLWMRRRF
jgi:homoaconitase/3-isopropylmalate dehydratase large subunit